MQLVALALYEPVSVAAAIVTIGGAIGYLTSWGRGAVRSALALRNWRQPHRHTKQIPPAEPTEIQVRVLNAVLEHFLACAKPVRFRELDKELDLKGLRLRQEAESMPPGLLIPDPRPYRGFYAEDELMVAREGLRYCDRGGEALDILAQTLAYLARREKPFIPTVTQPHLTITSHEIRRELRLAPTQLEQVWLMLDRYEPHVRDSSTRDPNGTWSWTVSLEYVRPFRGIRTGDEYLRARAGESFAHQLEAEEALVRFTLTADLQPSLELSGEPIVLRVDNDGPSDEFEATVVEIANAFAAPTPWYVRWRGVSEPTKEILSGTHWILEIARDDAMHGAHGHQWTPGWMFLHPRDEETFVRPNGYGSPGAHYGLPMRIRIRVTPRSQPQRSLENTVTLWFTQQGRHALWDSWRAPT